MVHTRARLLVALVTTLCLVSLVCEAAADRSGDAVAAFRQRSRQKARRFADGVAAGVAGASLLSKVAEKIASAVSDHKLKAHGKQLEEQIKTSKALSCGILMAQVAAEAGRISQAAAIIKDAPNPKLSLKAERDADPVQKIVPLQKYYNELRGFAVRIDVSKKWIENQLVAKNMCPALKTAENPKAAAEVQNDKNVKGKADDAAAEWTVAKVVRVYDDALDIIALKLAKLQALIKVPPPPPANPGGAAAAPKTPTPKEFEEAAVGIRKTISEDAEKALVSIVKGTANGFSQDVVVDALAQVGVGAVADAVVPVMGIASTGNSLFSMGGTISDYYTEWERDEANKDEFLTDASFAACNMVLALFRDSCRFPVSDALFSILRKSAKDQSENLVKTWRSTPFGVLTAYLKLECNFLQKIQFPNEWQQVFAKAVAAIPEPSSDHQGQVADLFPAFKPLFTAAQKVTKDTQALSAIGVYQKGSDFRDGVPLMLDTKGEIVVLRAEFLPLLSKVPFGIVQRDKSDKQLLVPNNLPITGVEFITHDSAQKPSAAGGLYDDRRPGKGLHDTDKTKKHRGQLKEKGFNDAVIELTNDNAGHDRTATEIHVRRTSVGIPIHSIYLIHNEKGKKADTLTKEQEDYFKGRQFIRSHDDMTVVLRKQEKAGALGLGAIFEGFKQHDYFYFCAEKDPALYWDTQLNTLVTASRRKVF